MKLSRVKESLVKDAIKTLSYDEKKKFGYFCLDRIINLYEDVDSRIDISEANGNIENGTAYDTLISIYKDLKYNSPMRLSELQSKVEICDSLILDTDDIFDNFTENVIAKIVAESLYSLLGFHINKDSQEIFDCARLNIDIINAIMSDYFFKNVSNDEDVCDELLEALFVEEYDIQLKAIDLIKDHKRDEVNDLIKETIIYNKNIT